MATPTSRSTSSATGEVTRLCSTVGDDRFVHQGEAASAGGSAGSCRGHPHSGNASKVPGSSYGGTPSGKQAGKWNAFEQLKEKVHRYGTSVLKGSQVSPDFIHKLDILVDAGLFDLEKAEYLKKGVCNGFGLGLDADIMRGKRVFKNYPTAFEAKDKVTDALRERVKRGKTLKLGAFNGNPRS